MLKKVFVVVSILLTAFILIACDGVSINYGELIDEEVFNIPSEVSSNITLPTEITVEGITFEVSWSSDKPEYLTSNGVVNRPSFETGDVTVLLTATVSYLDFSEDVTISLTVVKLAQESYIVTFESSGGSTVPNQTVLKNGLIVKPTDPTKADHTFDGWYKESSFTTTWNFTLDKVTTNVTLYAKFTPVVVVTEFDVIFKDAEGNEFSKVVVENNQKVNQPLTEPTKIGFEFKGWSLDGTNLFDFESTLVTSDLILLPVFEIMVFDIVYEIPEGATLSTEGDLTFTVETTPLLKTASLEGMTFIGWFLDLEDETPVTTIEIDTLEDVVLYAKFEETVVLPEGTLIYTSEDLLDLIVNGGEGLYQLMNDIDMSGVTLTGSSKTFGGTFNGNGFTISNAVINGSGNKMGFLFKEVLNGGVVRNVKFSNSIHNGGGSSESSAFISAYAQGGATFQDIEFYNVSVIHAGSYAALLFGDVVNDSAATEITVKNITVINDENHWVEGNSYVGGLIGASRKAVTINVENVYFESWVKAPNQAAGIIMGRLNASGVVLNVSQVVAKGGVISAKNVGTVLGTNVSGSTMNANFIFISHITQTSGTNTVKIGSGNGPSGSTNTLDNAFYQTESTVFIVGTNPITMPEGTGLLSSEITDEWFETSGFNQTFFKALNGTLVRETGDTGPVEETGFSVSSNQVKKYYLVGEALDLTNLQVYATFSDGSSQLLEPSSYTVETDDFDTNTSGSYEVRIIYKGEVKFFMVDVVEVTHIEVDTLLFKETYMVNQTLNMDSFVVKSIVDDGSFMILKDTEYTLNTEALNLSLKGVYPVVVTYKTFEPVTIYIKVHEKDESNPTTVNLTVDSSYEGLDGDIVSDNFTFKTVKSAHQFLVNQNYASTVKKVMYIKNGIYREKLTITVPNLTLVGEDRDLTVLTYGAASSMLQPTGIEWGTQGSASISIKSSATNFNATNLTIQNDFDYNQSNLANKQGVALVNEADQVVFYRVNFKGYQDTLYAKQGRQYYYDVYIEGVVDFIFGNGGPAFFETSEIKSLARSTGVIATNKGYNTSSAQLLTYGYVFYQNTFTFEAGVPTGSVDLGRPWDKDAAIAYIDNTLDVHINPRGWTEMSGNNPLNARFFEYQNKDILGNILSKTTNGKLLTENEASLYMDKDVFFGTTNGQVTFTNTFDYQGQLDDLIGLLPSNK